jgi:NADH-quinone oxidoreductase subunit E
MTTNLAHIAETALLLLAAYLLGCIVGYATRRILHAGRGTRQVTAVPVPVAAQPQRVRSTAARLAASVEDEPPTAVPPPKPAAVEVVARQPKSVGSKPSVLAAPRNGAPDNLKQIKGIGPKIEASLQDKGIYHLDQIAGWNKANIDWVEAELAFKGRVRRERWVEQAAELCKVKASA